jgi:hypothetical protein
MKPSWNYRRRWTLILGATALGLPSFIHAGLAPDSPFLPASAAASSGSIGETTVPLELRGIISSDDGQEYCIYDRAKKSSTWVKCAEVGPDFLVKSGNSSDESVVLDYHGRSLRLVLKSSKVISSGAGTSPPSSGTEGMSITGNEKARTADSHLEPTEEEQNRLSATYSEVHRRLLERQTLLLSKNPAVSGP